MAAAIYATEGIEEDAKLPTVEAAILLTSTASGALMMALGQAKLGNIVRLLPSPVTGGFLAGRVGDVYVAALVAPPQGLAALFHVILQSKRVQIDASWSTGRNLSDTRECRPYWRAPAGCSPPEASRC